MIYVANTLPADLLQIEDTGTLGGRHILESLPGERREALLKRYSRTLWEESQPIALYGAFPLFEGCYQAWALLSDAALDHPVVLTRSVLRALDWLASEEPVRRVQMHVRDGFEAGQAWARFLGFIPEGLNRRYGPDGADYWIYARTEWTRSRDS